MKLLVIVGSARPVRVGDQIAGEVARVAEAVPGVELDVVDLAELKLPMLDEPVMAAMGQYAHDHTKSWSQTVAAADAILFVTPQYNGGYPASLKNAIDYLYQEWNGKPAAIVSYGGHGGNMSYDQLSQVFRVVQLRQLDGLQIKLGREDYGQDGRLVDAAATVGPHLDSVRGVVAGLVGAVEVPAGA